MSKPQPVAVTTPTENEKSYEEEHVHSVYQTIASHFSDTRYKVSDADHCVRLTTLANTADQQTHRQLDRSHGQWLKIS
jgi:hypothetical protein